MGGVIALLIIYQIHKLLSIFLQNFLNGKTFISNNKGCQKLLGSNYFAKKDQKFTSLELCYYLKDSNMYNYQYVIK